MTNKEVVIRFNKEILEQGNEAAFHDLVSPEFINHTSAPNVSAGPDGILYTVKNILHAAFSDLHIEIYEQLEDGNKVTSRKSIFGTHTGELWGIQPTFKKIKIDVIDIVHVQNGKYIEHWGINTLSQVINELKNGQTS